jgi:hypothetical protein
VGEEGSLSVCQTRSGQGVEAAETNRLPTGAASGILGNELAALAEMGPLDKDSRADAVREEPMDKNHPSPAQCVLLKLYSEALKLA